MKKCTTICSIFVLLCLLTNSTYAKTIGYEAKRDTTVSFLIYFDQKARQVDTNYTGNGETLASLDSLLANSVHAPYLYSIVLSAPEGYSGTKTQGVPSAREWCEEVKAFLCGRYPQVDAARIQIRQGKEYWAALRELIAADREVPDQEDVLALIDYHHPNPVKMQDFLQHLDAGIPYRYISAQVLPKLRRTEIKLSFRYPQETREKKVSAELAEKIKAMEFVPIDSETPLAPAAKPLTAQVSPQQKAASQVREETKTLTNTPKGKEHRAKQKKEKTNSKDEIENNTVLALKNNLLYDLALAPNIEIEIPIGRQWSVNAEYKCPWWSNSSEDFCYQLLSGGVEGRYWLGNRRIHRSLTGHFIGVYAEGGIYDFQFHGDGYQGKYYGAAGLSYGYSTQVSRQLAFEFSLGIGYLTTKYQKYTPYEGSLVWMSSGQYNFIGPTKAKVSLVWLITKRRERK